MSNPTTYRDLIHLFANFLTVCIHTITYERHIYPPHTYITARKYDFPVRQSRHPRVCSWITDAVTAVTAELLKCAVARVAVVVYSPRDVPLERFLFDCERFPVVAPGELDTPLALLLPSPSGEADGGGGRAPPGAVLVDLEEQFRATMSRLSGCGGRLGRVPEGSTFTVAVEGRRREGAEAPIARERKWVPVQPGKGGEGGGGAGVRTTPVRSVAAGGLAFEVWIEEGEGKFSFEEGQSRDGTGRTDGS